MALDYISLNGDILPAEEAVVQLSSIEYSYGFGVYESIALRGGTLYFGEDHCRRLIDSANVINLEHRFGADRVLKYVHKLLVLNDAKDCNVKILLVGGRTIDDANLYILCLNPLFPDRKLYKNGAHCITYEYERDFPNAKTLNMLPSYLAYRQAKQASAYDALLINRQGDITEGTRTNFFVIKGNTIFTPPVADILPGVTRAKVLQVANDNGYIVVEQPISATRLGNYDGAFVTSTSSKIMPLRSIEDHLLGPPSNALKRLILLFDAWLADYRQSAYN